MNKIKIISSILTISAVLAGLILLTEPVQAETPLPNSTEEKPLVISIEIDGEIRAGTVQFVRRALEKAKKENAHLFLLRLNTPGGLLKATEEITRLFLDSPVPTAVFVYKKGGWAFSAGTFILLSAETAVAHPNSSLGAAQPRFLGLDEVGKADEKVIEASASWMKQLAETRKRNAAVAEKFVRENLTLSGQEALAQGIVNFVAEDSDQLFAQLEIKNPRLVEVKQTLFETALSFFSIPQIVSLFLTLGVLGLIFTFRTGEPEIGIVAALFFLIGLWGIGAISISILGVVLLVLGVALLLAEFFTPEFGLLGITGTIAFLAGILLFGQEPFVTPVIFNAVTFFALGAGLAAVIFFIIIGRLTVKTLASQPKTGLEALIKKEGVAIEDLSPYGQVKIDEQCWRAKTEGENKIVAGIPVIVIGFSGNTLLVREKK